MVSPRTRYRQDQGCVAERAQFVLFLSVITAHLLVNQNSPAEPLAKRRLVALWKGKVEAA